MRDRKLVRLCEHDSLHAHYIASSKKPQPICPGGEFLTDDALVIELSTEALIEELTRRAELVTVTAGKQSDHWEFFMEKGAG